MALPDYIRHASSVERTTGISNQTIANAATFTGDAIDNATNRDTYLSAELSWSYATAPTAGKTVEIHVLYAVDGTNFEELSPQSLRAIVSPLADTSSHRRLVMDAIPLAPFKFKLAVKNVDTAQAITVTLKAYTWKTEVAD